MADANAPDAVLTFHHYGYIVASDPTSKHVEEPARADLKMVGRGREGFCVEVKDGKDENDHAYFDLSEWRDNQRDWALRFCEAYPYCTAYWIWLRMGLNQRHAQEPTLTWLIPRAEFLGVCQLVQPIQNRLVYRVRSGLDRDLQRWLFDAVNLLHGWQLTWNSGGINAIAKPDWMVANFPDTSPVYDRGIYTIPEQHPFYQRHLAEKAEEKAEIEIEVETQGFEERYAIP